MTDVTTREHGGAYLTVAEVAAELACSEPTVRRRIRDGELPAVRLGGTGSGARIPRPALEAWLWAGGEETRRAEGVDLLDVAGREGTALILWQQRRDEGVQDRARLRRDDHRAA